MKFSFFQPVPFPLQLGYIIIATSFQVLKSGLSFNVSVEIFVQSFAPVETYVFGLFWPLQYHYFEFEIWVIIVHTPAFSFLSLKWIRYNRRRQLSFVVSS